MSANTRMPAPTNTKNKRKQKMIISQNIAVSGAKYIQAAPLRPALQVQLQHQTSAAAKKRTAAPAASSGLGQEAKLALSKSRSAAVLLKRRNRRRPNNGGNDGSSGSGFGRATGAGGSGSSGRFKAKEPCQFVPVRRKPLGEYMKLAPASTSSSASAYHPQLPAILTYAAAVGSRPIPRQPNIAGVKVMISPRFKRGTKPGKPNKGKRHKKAQTAKPGNQFSIFAAEQPKPHIVHVDSKAFRTEELQPPKGKFKGKRNKKPKPKPSNHEAGDSLPTPVQTKPERTLAPPSPPSPPSPREFSDAFSYLNHHHLKLQRILAAQTAGLRPCIERGQPPVVASPYASTLAPAPASSLPNSNCASRAAVLKHPVQWYGVPVPFDDLQFRFCELEATALLAQNKAMMRIWKNPDVLIS